MNTAPRARKTHHINRKPASNLHHATRFATKIGLPLNQFATLNLTRLDKPAEEVATIFKALRSTRFMPWLRRHPKNQKRQAPPTYVWVQEGANGQATIHWAVHVPKGMIREFKRMLPLWLASVEDAAHNRTERVARVTPVSKRVVKVVPVYNITGLKRYMLKGVDPEYADLYKVDHVPQGTVIGRRSGFSRNLGPTARKAAGYKPRRVFR